jgi:uncharacterized protein involved in exopolysaccharide biosynthesis
MNTSPQPFLTPRDVGRVLFRHKGKMLLWSASVLLGAVAFTVFAPRSYLSESKLFVRLGRENVTLDSTATMGQGPLTAVPQSREEEINSVVEILTSRMLLEKTVDAVGPQRILAKPRRGNAVESGSDDATADPPQQTATFWHAVGKWTGALPTSSREQAIEKLERAVKVEGCSTTTTRANDIGVGHGPEALNSAVVTGQYTG